MADLKVRINTKTSTGYDTLHPETKGDIVLFDKSGSNLSATNANNAIKEVNIKADNAKSLADNANSLASSAKSLAETNKTNIGILSNLKTSIKNSIVSAINELHDKTIGKTLKTLNEINVATQQGFYVDALAIKELANNSIDKIQRQETVINSKVEEKQIYTKAFEIHPIPSNTSLRFQISIPDAKYIWLDASNSYAYNVQGGEIYPIPYISPKYPQNGLGVWINNSPQKQEIIIETATTWAEKYYAWIVLKYYKK